MTTNRRYSAPVINTSGKGFIMGIIVTIIVGFVVGLLARAIMPGNQSMGMIMTTILGIVGAIVGQFGANALGMTGPVGWIGSIVGAIIVLLIYGMVTKRG